MERKTLIKRLKGVMAMMLAFLILTGNPLIAQAKFYDADIKDTLNEGTILNEGDVIYAFATGGIAYPYIDGVQIPRDNDTYFYSGNLPEDPTRTNSFYFRVPNGTTLRLSHITSHSNMWDLYFVTVNGLESPASPTTVAPPHTHSYEWITTLEPTATTDGLCEYRCECGSVTASQPVSYATVLVKNILSDIQNAPENGTVTLNYDGLRCLSKKMVETLLSRPDVTLVVQFTDKDITRQFTIPAGQAPTDGADWYGYYYLGALYGWQ